ncbi:MAG: class I SAM-dependent methyltransferase [Gemmatimonadetes bacterium]|nr:class I SAM-dependent methyltransferase [Gemmatimonadota bacterium]
MTTTEPDYVPALAYDRLTPLYDGVMRWTMREKTFKNRLIEQASMLRGHRVLDLGCGTATLTLMVKSAHPEAEIVGLDGDPKVLALAQAKADRQGLEIQLDQGLSTDLPYEDGEFDRVVTSLLFHHLTSDSKVRTMHEVFRVLKPGGELHVADFGKPQNSIMRALFYLVQLLDGFETTRDNVRGALPALIAAAGFEAVERRDEIATPVGTITLYAARRPEVM